MFFKMHFLSTLLAIILTLCTLSFAYTPYARYVDVHEVDKNTLEKSKQVPPADPAIHSFPTEPTVPLIPVCKTNGYFRDPFNCRKFYRCEYENAIPVGFYCQSDLIFDPRTNTCEQPQYVDC